MSHTKDRKNVVKNEKKYTHNNFAAVGFMYRCSSSFWSVLFDTTVTIVLCSHARTESFSEQNHPWSHVLVRNVLRGGQVQMRFVCFVSLIGESCDWGAAGREALTTRSFLIYTQFQQYRALREGTNNHNFRLYTVPWLQYPRLQSRKSLYCARMADCQCHCCRYISLYGINKNPCLITQKCTAISNLWLFLILSSCKEIRRHNRRRINPGHFVMVEGGVGVQTSKTTSKKTKERKKEKRPAVFSQKGRV